MDKKRFDTVVIGAGPGGYVAAIRLAQNGKNVCLVEKNALGGSCLNVGCIPTKTLLAGADVLHKINKAEEYGIITGPVTVDFKKMKERKDGVVSGIRKSLGGLLQSNKITIMEGTAEFLSPREIKVTGKDQGVVRFETAIIATGSEPLDIPAFPCDHKKILNSSSALELTTLPNHMAIIGGGYIGCEFASLYAEMGVKITILEALPSILTPQGKTIGDTLSSSFTKKGIDIKTGVFVEGIDDAGSGVKIRLKDHEPLEADLALVAVGRKIHSDGMAIEKAGVLLGDRGVIPVTEKMETNVPGIYAIGDVTGRFMLAHVASHQGMVAADNILGKKVQMHYNAVPAVIFTNPEIALVGMTAEEATGKGHDVNVGRFPFQALGKSVATIETEGFTEVISDKKTGQILGAQVIGHEASVLIAEMALAIANELTLDCVTETIHAHPTVAEGWLEASLLAGGTPIHMPPKRKA